MRYSLALGLLVVTLGACCATPAPRPTVDLPAPEPLVLERSETERETEEGGTDAAWLERREDEGKQLVGVMPNLFGDPEGRGFGPRLGADIDSPAVEGLAAEVLSGADHQPRGRVARDSGKPPGVPDDVDRVLRQALPRMRLCYEAELKRAPELKGRAVLHFVIAPDGTVSASHVRPGLDPALDACLARQIGRTLFRRPDDGQPMNIAYPLRFEPRRPAREHQDVDQGR